MSHLARGPAIPHPQPFSRREKGGRCLLSPSGREVGSEGTGIDSKASASSGRRRDTRHATEGVEAAA